jgi:hypothetical protein
VGFLDNATVTLILTAAIRSFVVQVSDRRLTTSATKVVTDQECKSIHFQVPNQEWQADIPAQQHELSGLR